MEDSAGLSASELADSSNYEDLRSTVHKLELELARSKEEKARLIQQLEEVADERDRTSKRLQENETRLAEQDRTIKNTKTKPTSEVTGAPNLAGFQQEIRSRDQEINNLREQLKNREKALEGINSGYYLDEERIRDLQDSQKEKILKIEELEARLEASQNSIDNLHVNKRAEGTLLLEIDHLKADNKRLVTLLKSTSEFKEFSGMAEFGPGMRYLPEETPKKKSYGETANKELDDWVPSEAWRIAHDFLARYGSSGFKPCHVNRLLEDLNKAWRERERHVIKTSKTQCAREVEKLKRKITNTPTYEEVRTQNELERVKGDLKKAENDLRIISSASAKANVRPTEIERVMKIVSDFEHENKMLAFENNKLRSRAEEEEE